MGGVRANQLAAKALKEGFFKEEILPIEAEQADGTTMVVDRDQAIREGASMEGMVDLKPAYKPDGVITAGNSSPLNAGATAMLLMSKDTAKKKGIKPLATIRSIGFAGVDPTIMGVGPVPASRMALEKAGMKVNDIDYWEINEAFCIVALNCIKELGIDPDRVNIMGGATGIRLVGTLARILQVKDARYGCALPVVAADKVWPRSSSASPMIGNSFPRMPKEQKGVVALAGNRAYSFTEAHRASAGYSGEDE
jgi:acetyl-CoA acyltransferase